jgi:hypothetical protein
MSTETQAKTNIFAKAKKKETTTTKEKDVVVVSEEKHEGFSDKLLRLKDLRANIDNDSAEAELLEDQIKQVGKLEFLRLYEEEGKRPESFKLAGEKGGKFLFMVIDKYAPVPDDARAEELRSAYGEKTVSKFTEYALAKTVLEQWERDGVLNDKMEALSNAVMECDALTDDEKENLFVVTEKYYITKGSLEKLMSVKAEERTGFFYNIQPQCQLKNCK